jgi:hypothetical protein
MKKERLRYVFENEQRSIDSWDENEDDYFDPKCDIEKAIICTKSHDAKKRVVVGEWSGQDIISGLEPYKVNKILLISNIRVYRRGLLRPFFKLREYLESFIRSDTFENFMTICVTLNTLILAFDHYGINKNLERVFTNLNLAFTIVFGAEMFFKLIGLGIKNYLMDRMNYLDGSVVILSIVELAFLSNSGGSLSAFRAVRIFRTFRVLRVARLLKSMQSMQVIIGVIGRSISSFVYLALLLLLFIFIYSLMGMQLFGGIYNDHWEEEKPRANFDTFGAAFLTVFQVLTMENWQNILFTMMSQAGFIAAIYLISWIFIGNFVLLNLFLAILLDSFIEEDEEEKKELKEQNQLNGINEGATNDEGDELYDLKDKEGEELLTAIKHQIKYDLGHGDDDKDGKKFVKKNRKKKDENANLLDESIDITPETLAKKESEIKPSKVLYDGVECEKSFFLVPKSNPLRIWIYKLTEMRGFEFFILIIIIFSSLKLIVDTYLLNEPSDSPLVMISNYLDFFFTVFFALESLFKAIASGLIMERGSYLRESWNQLDFFIVVTSTTDMIFSDINLPVIKILRLLRTLRPLRFISHNSGIKIVVVALIQSIGHIMNVAIVVLLVWLMFAILGVSLFGGKFQY